MADEVSIAKIEFGYDNNKKYSTEIKIFNAQLILSDKEIMLLLNKANIGKITSLNITLGVNKIAILISDYTLTDSIYFSAFYDMPSNISIFQSWGTNVHVVNQKIDLLQLDCQSFILGDCQIRELGIGLAGHMKLLDKDSETKDNSILKAYKMKSIDLRDCQISAAKAFVECESINIQGCHIEIFNIHGGIGSKVIAVVNQLHIWQYSSIGISEIHCKVDNYKLEESTISNLVAKANCLFNEISIDDSVILNAHKFEKKHFKKMDINAWILIGKSAENNKNLNMKAEANYQIAKESYKTENGINKFIGKLFGFCTGYGYKPMRALLSCVIMIVLAFLILSIKDFIFLGSEAIAKLNCNLVVAISAIAGQSGLTIKAGFKFWIATLEYIGAIIIFAMFVNTLYVRYKD